MELTRQLTTAYSKLVLEYMTTSRRLFTPRQRLDAPTQRTMYEYRRAISEALQYRS